MSVANAQGAIRGSSLFPCDPNIILQHAYAPTITTDCHAPTMNESATTNLPAVEQASTASYDIDETQTSTTNVTSTTNCGVLVSNITDAW